MMLQPAATPDVSNLISARRVLSCMRRLEASVRRLLFSGFPDSNAEEACCSMREDDKGQDPASLDA